MITIEGNLAEQQALGRWIIVDGGLDFSIDEATRVAKLQTQSVTTVFKRGKPTQKAVKDAAVLASSWEKFVAWSNIPPRKHGKFYVSAELVEGVDLDDRFIKVV